MPTRKEEEVEIYGYTYKVKQLSATKGSLLLLKLSRLIFAGAGSLGELLEKPEVKKLIDSFFSNDFIITDEVLALLPSDVSPKLLQLKGQVFSGTDDLKAELETLLSADEMSQHFVMISMKSAVGKDSSDSIVSISSQLLQLVRDIMINMDEDIFTSLLSNMINESVLRCRGVGKEKWDLWLHPTAQIYIFDDHFAGRYNAMLELFVFLLIFNYAESFLMLKKNQISKFLRPILDKLMLKVGAETAE